MSESDSQRLDHNLRHYFQVFETEMIRKIYESEERIRRHIEEKSLQKMDKIMELISDLKLGQSQTSRKLERQEDLIQKAIDELKQLQQTGNRVSRFDPAPRTFQMNSVAVPRTFQMNSVTAPRHFQIDNVTAPRTFQMDSVTTLAKRQRLSSPPRRQTSISPIRRQAPLSPIRRQLPIPPKRPNPASVIRDPASKIQDPASKIQDSISKVQDAASKPIGRRFLVPDPRIHGGELPSTTAICVFCKNKHYSDECPIIKNAMKRKEFLTAKKRCHCCLKPLENHESCPPKECRYCKYKGDTRSDHHSAICQVPENISVLELS